MLYPVKYMLHYASDNFLTAVFHTYILKIQKTVVRKLSVDYDNFPTTVFFTLDDINFGILTLKHLCNFK